MHEALLKYLCTFLTMSGIPKPGKSATSKKVAYNRLWELQECPDVKNNRAQLLMAIEDGTANMSISDDPTPAA